MEKNMAIMIADLSGYSALTETHGAVSAARLVDKYIQMAGYCMVGSCVLHQQTGDEIMFMADSPDDMLATALNLAGYAATEDYFLQVHGGLHFGKVLKHGVNYFGTAVNLTARIAGKASPGSFYCSAEFADAVTNPLQVSFRPAGNHHLKNIAGVKEIFEVWTATSKSGIIDPVCRMLILHPENTVLHPQQDHLYFCSSQCLSLFTATAYCNTIH